VQKRARARADQRDIVLYVPDRLLAYDRATGRGVVLAYDFAWKGSSTAGLPYDTPPRASMRRRRGRDLPITRPANIRRRWETARARVRTAAICSRRCRGNYSPSRGERSPAEVFQRLCRINPSPYGALMNLGEGEFLVSASPEMFRAFRRAAGRDLSDLGHHRARGVDAIGDAEQIRQLLNSEKRRIRTQTCALTSTATTRRGSACPAPSRCWRGARSRPIRNSFTPSIMSKACCGPGFDSLDAFLTHAWAVTVTGAPKLWAMQFVEDNERSSRRWYAGAIGAVNFDGSINTGLTIRTIRMKDGLAEVRVGATCLFDFRPRRPKTANCQVKAAALFQALRGDPPKPLSAFAPDATGLRQAGAADRPRRQFCCTCWRIIFRQVGASVTVVRHVHAQQMLNQKSWDLLVLSPGPGPAGGFRDFEDHRYRARKKSFRFSASASASRRSANIFGGQLGQLGPSRAWSAVAGPGPRRAADAETCPMRS